MKRDDFKFKDKSDMNAVFYDKAIDVAFNYFESRTCKSCLEGYNLPLRGVICSNGVRQYQDKNNDIDFYCNKWTAKDDK